MRWQFQQPDKRPYLWVLQRKPTYWTHYQNTQREAKTPSSYDLVFFGPNNLEVLLYVTEESERLHGPIHDPPTDFTSQLRFKNIWSMGI